MSADLELSSDNVNGFIAIIECGQKQAYVFGANKLRVQTSASELIFRVGTDWFLFAIDSVFESQYRREKNGSFDLFESHEALLKRLDGLVVLCATSGLAIFWCIDRDKAKRVCESVSTRALIDAPGLEVNCCIKETSEFSYSALQDTFIELQRVRSTRIIQSNRFVQLPFIAQCQVSQLPAATHKKAGSSTYRVSTEVDKKWIDGRTQFWSRLVAFDRELAFCTAYLDGLNIESQDLELTDWKCPWIAVVHIDGNAFGSLFQSIEILEEFQRTTQLIDRCIITAFAETIKSLYSSENLNDDSNGKRLPVPMILGGDDLTVILPGEDAIGFMSKFISAFETASEEILERKLTCGAGICFTKPKYPLHVSVKFAEQLCSSAKMRLRDLGLSTSKSCFDFHFVYDTTPTDVEIVREPWSNGDYRFFSRPFILGEETWMQVVTAVKLFREHPHRVLYELRSKLDIGPELAETLFEWWEKTDADFAKRAFPKGLFTETDGTKSTILMDIIDLMEVGEPDSQFALSEGMI
jgi:hypothetical protein